MPQAIKTKVNNPDFKETKKSIFFIGGEKGGVGKSFMARCLVDYFVSKQWKEKFYLVEGDPTIGDVGSIFQDNFAEVRFSDNKYTWDEPNIIVDRIEEKTAVVNLPSNVMSQFDSWIERLGILSLKEDYCEEIVYFFVSDGCWSSMELFLKQLETYDTKLFPHCLVLNKGRLTSSGSFEYLPKFCPELIEALQRKRVPTIYLPELAPTAQFLCDRTNLSYSELYNTSKEELAKKLDKLVIDGEGKDKLLKNMTSRLTNISAQKQLEIFLRENQNLFNKIFPKQLETPVGLKSIYEKQKQDLSKGMLPSQVSDG